jgi:hypothetical protein
MNQNVGQVIKKNQVKISGACRLGPDAVVSHKPQTASAARPGPAAASCGSPQVRIAENSPKGVVLEFTCACGSKTYIQCDYASAI